MEPFGSPKTQKSTSLSNRLVLQLFSHCFNWLKWKATGNLNHKMNPHEWWWKIWKSGFPAKLSRQPLDTLLEACSYSNPAQMVAASLQVSTLQMCFADKHRHGLPDVPTIWHSLVSVDANSMNSSMLHFSSPLCHFVSFSWRKHEADLRQEMRRELATHYQSPHIKSKARSRRSHCSAQGSLLVRRVRRRPWRTSSWKSSVMNWSWRLNPWRLPKKRSKWRGLRPPWSFEACCTWKLFCGFLRKG